MIGWMMPMIAERWSKTDLEWAERMKELLETVSWIKILQA
jgi:hypothetical protein